MKHIYNYLIGGKMLGKNNKYKYFPNTKEKLIKAIEAEIKLQGPEADLNCIDTSEITDMSNLFDMIVHDYAKTFNGDISDWNVSNVENMSHMFRCVQQHKGKFNRDISSWDVSNVENMRYMFCNAQNFNGDISNWNVSKVEDMSGMFCNAQNFNRNISKWNVGKVRSHNNMFKYCPIKEEYKPVFK